MLHETLYEWEVLKGKIIAHRKNCEEWKKGDPCFDCHNDTIGKIEKELNKKFLEISQRVDKHV